MRMESLGTFVMSRLWLSLVLLVVSSTAWADRVDRIAEHVHAGVASCATSVCHGKLKIQDNENVWLNEYRIWTSEDRHSQAYRTLENQDSKRIAAKLGLKSAKTAKICLDCHADNVPKNKRGRKFQIRDGVGCEACHGGSEKWLKSHAESGISHQQNVADGLYPTEKIDERADLCLSCHLGTKDKFATHVIMGAGHPRLGYELETFTANQPAHYTVDADYIKRKGKPLGFNAWVLGQVTAAERFVALLQTPLFKGKGLFPELAMYDCQSCHHPMDDLRWSYKRSGGAVKPGTLRLQSQYFVGVEVAAKVLESPAAAKALRGMVNQLLVAGQTSTAAVTSAAKKLENWLSIRRDQWRKKSVSLKQVKQVRKQLLSMAANDKASDYNAAEQVFLSVEGLSYVVGDVDKHEAALDKLYKAVEDDKKYSPARFAKAAKSAIKGF